MRHGVGQGKGGAPRLAGKILLPAMALAVLTLLIGGPSLVMAAGKITEIVLGENAGSGKSQTQFATTAPEIKGVAKVTGAQAGQQISADLIYVTQDLKALSITKEISGTGDLTFNFSFSKPTNNWPPGDYKIVISTSDGALKEAAFQVK